MPKFIELHSNNTLVIFNLDDIVVVQPIIPNYPNSPLKSNIILRGMMYPISVDEAVSDIANKIKELK